MISDIHEVIFRDKIKFLFARLLFKETILFSRKDDWELLIREKIKGYVPFFYELNEISPDYFDLIVPLTLHAQKYINAQPGLRTEKKVLVPSNRCIDLCDNKERFQYYLVKNGFERFTPRTNEKFCYPYILKKKIDEWGVNISIINDSRSERVHKCEIESADYFKQEYIEGKDEYTAHVIFDGKRVVFLKALKFTFTDRFFIKGKYYKPASWVKVDHSHFKDIFEDILVEINYQGICCFNYKIAGKDIKIFEVNPRYGASMTYFINEALASYRDTLSNT